MKLVLNKSFTINDMAKVCSQQPEYGHILSFRRELGWIGRRYAMTNGSALSNSYRVKRRIMASRPKTIGVLLRPYCGPCAPAVRGATFRKISVIGIGPLFASRAGARNGYGGESRRCCVATLIWSIRSSTQPSFVPTSILLAPKKTGGQEIGRLCGGLTTKLHVAVDALGNPLRAILFAG